MYKIISKKLVVPKEFDVWVEAPRVARHVKPGQFVIIRTNPQGERVPLTVADYDREKGLIRMIFQTVGKTTAEFADMNVGDCLTDILGPLGTPSEIKNYGTVLMVGGGVGIAALFPIIRALKEAGNKVYTILGGRTKDLVIMKEECEKYSDELLITTDDGSAGKKGVVTDAMVELAERGVKIDQSWAIGPSIMMKFASLKAKELDIPMFVSLNPIMIDGTGMCGGCRVTIHDQIRFACVDGPEFDGWGVNWNEFMNRMRQYKDEEKMSLEKYKAEMGEE
ncbi:sulfide/dihydroorotate dehydrogenase-like FAD/NAD-binding protein [Aminobacterium colombiense]|uniref:Oxidoreductase FAD/NAD(P)-binding domain protein n=1 Tax=Aminobacterium colombiense (strain DSM 12261 / ALA-1) TaxID=572547 RepID=D5EG03_AMICL|nr:sulfide/dihydroorotate dehydrogenase-like FAD/NAD-binding protein [Aminobacterium colombiense]ADE57485.1 oxidoreductase FAD/NAD(P)-binding domain protein [Aminobacterium colombiense DSM 12261]